MNFLTATYTSLRNPTGAPQTALDTIQKLSDRLSNSTLLSDRRAAVLSLKSLASSWKEDVSTYALEPILGALLVDPQADPESGRAILETIEILCEADKGEDGKVSRDDLGLRNSDVFLATPEPTHALIKLLQSPDFYNQFLAVRLLSSLLSNRPIPVQKHFLTSLDGPISVVTLLQTNRDMTRTEALQMIQLLIASNTDLQKILTFEGIFEILFKIIRDEDGIEGSVIALECLTLIDSLLRYNVSNQNYFRELGLPPLLPQLLHFPSPQPKEDEPSPQEFNLQIWSNAKWKAASIVVGIIGILAKGKGGSNKGLEQSGAFRCLLEIALSSNAPTPLKSQALHSLPTPSSLHISLTPYIPVPDTNGEEWDRLPPETALSLLVTTILEGEFGGALGGDEGRDGMELRAAGVRVFEGYMATKPEEALGFLAAMVPTPAEHSGEESHTPSSLLLRSLLTLPPNQPTNSTTFRLNLSCILFSSLVRSSEQSKSFARTLLPLPAPPPPTAPEDEEDPPPTLLSSLLGNLSLSSRSRALSREQGKKAEVRNWDRIIVGYLKVLCFWCWDAPGVVQGVLGEGGVLGVIIEPITQTSEVDTLVQGLSAFLLGVCYEFNREPGEITRTTIHPIIHSRIGADVFTGRIAQVREDERFKAVGPDEMFYLYDDSGDGGVKAGGGDGGDGRLEGEIWVDWEFVEFWKGNCYSIQRAIQSNPDATSSHSASHNPETLALVASLRETIRKQAVELEALQDKLIILTREREDERDAFNTQIASLSDAASRAKEVEKEQEDLLILLEETTTKRKRDKARMREKGMDVSEDEDEEGDDDDDEENGE